VDLDLDADELALQQGVRRFCADRFPLSVARQFGTPGGFDRDRWAELGELGVFDVLSVSTSETGGLGAVGAVVVFEELGRALVPGPLIACVLARGLAEGVCEGRAVVTAVERPRSGPAVLEHLAAASSLIVTDDEGVWHVDTADLGNLVAAEALDPTSTVAVVTRLPQGTQVGGPEQASSWRLYGSLLASSMLAGISSATTDLATQYAKARHQFGKPIGSFQAIKHMLADMLARSEVCRASVYMAGAVVDDPSAGRPEDSVASARVIAGQWAVDNARSCIQVHGGIGFTWEADPHLYLKRSWSLANCYGGVDSAAEVVASSL